MVWIALMPVCSLLAWCFLWHSACFGFLKTLICRVLNPKFLEIWQFPKYVLFNFKRFYLALDLALFIYWVSDPSLRIMPFQIYLLILFCMGLIPKIIVIGLCSLTDLPVSSLGMAIYFLVSDPNFMEDQNCHNDFDYIAFYYASSTIVVFGWFLWRLNLEVPPCLPLIWGYYLPTLNKKFLSSHLLLFIFSSTNSEKTFFLEKLKLITF